jgi:hypothetical protein
LDVRQSGPVAFIAGAFYCATGDVLISGLSHPVYSWKFFSRLCLVGCCNFLKALASI